MDLRDPPRRHRRELEARRLRLPPARRRGRPGHRRLPALATVRRSVVQPDFVSGHPPGRRDPRGDEPQADRHRALPLRLPQRGHRRARRFRRSLSRPAPPRPRRPARDPGGDRARPGAAQGQRAAGRQCSPAGCHPALSRRPALPRADLDRRQLCLPRPQPVRPAARESRRPPRPRSGRRSRAARAHALARARRRDRDASAARELGAERRPSANALRPGGGEAPARRSRFPRPRWRRSAAAAAPAPHLQDLDRRNRAPASADPAVDVARGRRRGRDPLLRVRDLLRRHQARQLPDLQPDLDRYRRPRHLHAHPALAAHAARGVEPGALLRMPASMRSSSRERASPTPPRAGRSTSKRRRSWRTTCPICRCSPKSTSPSCPPAWPATVPTRAASSTACARCIGRTSEALTPNEETAPG